jgi:plasmid stabilization system protein ParE
VNLFVQEAAEQNLLSQVEWYAEQGLPDIARRFHTAVLDAIDALLAMPEAGPPNHTGNPRLTGLRSWHVKGFDEFRVHYMACPELITVVRILHSKRDTGTILTRQELEER